MGSKIILVLMTALTSAAFAAPDPENVYVKLYEQRLEMARIVAKKRAQELKYQLLQQDRIQRLYEKQASTAAELEERQLASKVAELATQDAEAKIIEAATMRDIARERTNLGLEMPICPGNPVQ